MGRKREMDFALALVHLNRACIANNTTNYPERVHLAVIDAYRIAGSRKRACCDGSDCACQGAWEDELTEYESEQDAARLLSAGEALAEAASGHHHSHAVAGREPIEWCEICQALSVWHETFKAVGEGTENEEARCGNCDHLKSDHIAGLCHWESDDMICGCGDWTPTGEGE